MLLIEAEKEAAANGKHVIVINKALKHDVSKLKNYEERYTPMGAGGGFALFFFDGGTFVNNNHDDGDGGWLNWDE